MLYILSLNNYDNYNKNNQVSRFNSTLTIDNIVRLRVQWTACCHVACPDEIDAYGALIFAREMGGPAGGESCMHAAKKVELIQSARSDPFRTDPEAHGGGRRSR